MSRHRKTDGDGGAAESWSAASWGAAKAEHAATSEPRRLGKELIFEAVRLMNIQPD